MVLRYCGINVRDDYRRSRREEGAWMIDFEVTNQADKGAAVHWSMFQGVRFTIESTDMGAAAMGEYVVEIELALQVEESPALQVQESPQHLHTTHSLQNFEVHPYFQNNAWFAFQIGVVQKKWTSEWCWTSRESDEVSWGCLRSAFQLFNAVKTTCRLRLSVFHRDLYFQGILHAPFAEASSHLRAVYQAPHDSQQPPLSVTPHHDSQQVPQDRVSRVCGARPPRALVIVIHGDGRGTERWLQTLLATPLQGGDSLLHSFIWVERGGNMRTVRATSRAQAARSFSPEACCADLDTVLLRVAALEESSDVPLDAVVYAIAAGTHLGSEISSDYLCESNSMSSVLYLATWSSVSLSSCYCRMCCWSCQRCQVLVGTCATLLLLLPILQEQRERGEVVLEEEHMERLIAQHAISIATVRERFIESFSEAPEVDDLFRVAGFPVKLQPAASEFAVLVTGVIDAALWRECTVRSLLQNYVKVNRADVFLMVLFDPTDPAAVELLWELHEAAWVTGLLALVFDMQTVRLIERAHAETLGAKAQYTHLSLLRLKLDLLGGDADAARIREEQRAKAIGLFSMHLGWKLAFELAQAASRASRSEGSSSSSSSSSYRGVLRMRSDLRLHEPLNASALLAEYVYAKESRPTHFTLSDATESQSTGRLLVAGPNWLPRTEIPYTPKLSWLMVPDKLAFGDFETLRVVCDTFLYLGVDGGSVSEAENQFALALLDQGVREEDILEVPELKEVDRRLERYFSAGASANEEEEDVLRNDRWLREGWSSWDGKRAGCQGAGRISWILPGQENGSRLIVNGIDCESEEFCALDCATRYRQTCKTYWWLGRDNSTVSGGWECVLGHSRTPFE